MRLEEIMTEEEQSRRVLEHHARDKRRRLETALAALDRLSGDERALVLQLGREHRPGRRAREISQEIRRYRRTLLESLRDRLRTERARVET